LENAQQRECLVDVCQRYKYLGVKEIEDAFAKINGFDPQSVPTKAKDMGPSQKPGKVPGQLDNSIGGRRAPTELQSQGLAASMKVPLNTHLGRLQERGPGRSVEVPRFVVFCLDWSASMKSQDTGVRGANRFDICIQRVLRILKDQVRENDIVSVVGFGAKVETPVPPTRKSSDTKKLETLISGLKPSEAGGTCFFDAVAQCLQMHSSGSSAPRESPCWLLCLTDGDDLGSRQGNKNGELVTKMLDAGIPKLNMIMITVGKLQDKNMRVISSWTENVSRNGGHGQLLSEKDAVSIGKAFEVVAEMLAADVGGAIEC
jgi:Mg-chelatase subunit ChlD